MGKRIVSSWFLRAFAASAVVLAAAAAAVSVPAVIRDNGIVSHWTIYPQQSAQIGFDVPGLVPVENLRFEFGGAQDMLVSVTPQNGDSTVHLENVSARVATTYFAANPVTSTTTRYLIVLDNPTDAEARMQILMNWR